MDSNDTLEFTFCVFDDVCAVNWVKSHHREEFGFDWNDAPLMPLGMVIGSKVIDT